MFMSLPFTPREVKATEARLQRIYNGAQLGLKGDRLAVFAGMLPVEYHQLKQLDPVVELAELKGRTDAEVEAATTLRNSSLSGDAKSALAILQHQHDWTAQPAVSQGFGQGGITIVIGEVQSPYLESHRAGAVIEQPRQHIPNEQT